jgi:hypothetical protein
MIRDARTDDAEAIRALTLVAHAEYAAAIGDHWADDRAGLLRDWTGPWPRAASPSATGC